MLYLHAHPDWLDRLTYLIVYANEATSRPQQRDTE
jgi:hypothetical protein